MDELGYGNNYYIKFRHFLLQPGEQRVVTSYNQFFLLIEPSDSIRVESNVGVFDLSEQQANEFQYEHQGEIAITNYSISINHLRMIQVIPKNCS